MQDFGGLQERLVVAPVLIIPYHSMTFTVYYDLTYEVNNDTTYVVYNMTCVVFSKEATPSEHVNQPHDQDAPLTWPEESWLHW